MWRWSMAARRPLAAAAGLAAAQGLGHGPPTKCHSAPVRSETKLRKPQPMPPAVEVCDLHGCSTGKRIAVLGGSFDPITNGHIVSACEVLHAGHADEVWIVPCGARPDKPSLKTPYRHRLLMCHLAVDTNFGSRFPIRVCDCEMLEPSGAMPCYDLMHWLKGNYPAKDFMFVIGTDLYEDLHKWDTGHRIEWLMHENKWLVFDRPGYKRPEQEMPQNFKMITAGEGQTMTQQELASSEIRKRIASGMTVDGLIPPAVLAHIIRYNLYD